MRVPMSLLVGVLACSAVAGALAVPRRSTVDYTTDFRLEKVKKFSAWDGNDYWSLDPGTFRRYEGDDDGEFVELEITVLADTKAVTFDLNGKTIHVTTRVIEEREWVDGELVEVSRNFFARDKATNHVYYFGEEVDIYEDGEIVSHDGAWLAGENGALPGLIMPSVFLLGSRYYQEIAPDVALDRAEHAEADLVVTTPAGTFSGCVRIVETSPLDPPGQQSEKFYAPGIGLICDDGIELVEYH